MSSVPAPPRHFALVAARHPLARLAAAGVLMVVVFVTLDGLTAAIVLAVLVAATPAAGLSGRELLRRAWPLLAAAAGIGLVNAVFAADTGGDVLATTGPLRITTGSLAIGFALAVRLLAVAVAAVLAVARLDPTELADALVQQLGVSARFAIGALAAVRTVPIFRAEWEILGRARRARGIDAGRSPLRAIGLFAGRVHALFVGAIRRGLLMASAMDARGFGALPCRTFARERPMRSADWLLIGAAAAVGLVATSISVAVGTWRFLLS